LKTNLLHDLAVSWTSIINRHVKREGIELQKMVLGMEIILHNVPKIILMVAIAFLVGILPLTMVTWLSFACIRRYAAGLHAENSITCTIITLLMFVAVPYAVQGVYINEAILFSVFAILGFGLYKYSPADTAARPIIGKLKRARLKRKSLIACFILPILAWVLRLEAFYVYVATGAMFAVLSVLPLTYKLLGRSVNNYEQYE
jgi:accessory gene regulator B